ncbi:transmembrane protein 6/97 [Obelidium mucronatum]|nr:transmembrane protein 6/97 [Obelidium mucronatum]
MTPPQRPITSRPGDIAMILFFALHIPISFLIGAQTLFPEFTQANYHQSIIDVAANWARDANDYLAVQKPLWFVSALWCELLIQVPLYFYLIWAIIVDSKHVRTAGIIYGTHTCTIMVPIMFEMLMNVDAGFKSVEQRWALISVYAVWFFIPLAILYAMVFRQVPAVSAGKAKKQ